MADYVTKIRTTEGDKQIDFRALAYLPASETYITADEREYWNQKMDPTDVLSDESAALYGLEKGASSDDVFSFLGKYNQHWWKLVTNSRVTKYEEQRRAFAEEYDENIHLYKKSGTIFYADDYTINEDTGDVSLVNQSQMNADDSWEILYGKYIQSPDGGITATNMNDNIEENVVDIIYHSSNPSTISYDNDDTGTDNYKPGRGYEAKTSDEDPFKVILAISYMLNVGEVEYKYSTKRNEYPDSGTVNGVIYDYLGIPFDNISQSTKMDVKIGDIKHSLDTNQGEDWILADGSILSHTEYPEIGNFLKDNLTVVPTKINNSELYSSWYINDVVCVNGLYVGAGTAKLKTSSRSSASIFYTNDLYGIWDVLVVDNINSSSSFDRISYGNGQYVAYSSNSSSTLAFASQSPKTSWTKINALGYYAHIVYGNGYWVLVNYASSGSNSSQNKSFYYTSNIFNGFDTKTYVTCVNIPEYATRWVPMFHDNTLCVVASNGGSNTYLLTNEDFINGEWKTTKISNFYGISIQYINGMYIITGGKYNKNSYYPGFAFSNNLTDGWKTISIYNSAIANNSYDEIARPIAYDEIGKRWAVAYSLSSSIYVYLSEDANLEGTWSLYQFSSVGTSYPSTNLFLNNNKFAYISNNKLVSNEYFTTPKLHDAKNGYSTYIKIR